MNIQNQQLVNYIGQGITLPLRLENGSVPLDTGFVLIRASIITIITWDYGTRFFLAEFGSKLNQLLEDPNDKVTMSTVNVFIADAINQWEPRVEYISSAIYRTKDYNLYVKLTYRIIATQQEDTFIFPFYKKIMY